MREIEHQTAKECCENSRCRPAGWSPYALASCSEDMLIPLRMMESRSLLKGTLKLGILAKKLFKTSTAMKEMHCVLAPSMIPGVQVAPLTLYFFQ